MDQPLMKYPEIQENCSLVVQIHAQSNVRPKLALDTSPDDIPHTQGAEGGHVESGLQYRGSSSEDAVRNARLEAETQQKPASTSTFDDDRHTIPKFTGTRTPYSVHAQETGASLNYSNTEYERTMRQASEQAETEPKVYGETEASIETSRKRTASLMEQDMDPKQLDFTNTDQSGEVKPTSGSTGEQRPAVHRRAVSDELSEKFFRRRSSRQNPSMPLCEDPREDGASDVVKTF